MNSDEAPSVAARARTKVIDGSQSGVNSRQTRCAAIETSEAIGSRVLCIQRSLASRKTQSFDSKPNVCGCRCPVGLGAGKDWAGSGAWDIVVPAWFWGRWEVVVLDIAADVKGGPGCGADGCGWAVVAVVAAAVS